MQINQISPEVMQFIKPIVDTMSRIDMDQRYNRTLGPHNEPREVKEFKKQCVHVIYDGSDYHLSVKKLDNGNLRCTACGREINTKFDKDAVETLVKSVSILNGLALFGMLNGLNVEPLATLVSMKTTLPAVAQLHDQFNNYISKSEQNNDAVHNLGAEYNTPSLFDSITRM